MVFHPSQHAPQEQAAFSAAALTCPRCGASATPSPAVQLCAKCGTRFTLRAGRLLDRAVQPPPTDAAWPPVRVKFSGFPVNRTAMVTSTMLSEGILDPVTGLIPLESGGIAYPEIVSVTVWRKVDVAQLLVALFVALPIMLLCALVALAGGYASLLLTAAFAAILMLGLWRALVVKAHFIRVVGGNRSLTFRFDSPMSKRLLFHDELLRRAGITPSAIP